MVRAMVPAAAAWVLVGCVDGTGTTTATDITGTTTGDSGTTEALTLTGDWTGSCDVVLPEPKKKKKEFEGSIEFDLELDLTDEMGVVVGTGTADVSVTPKKNSKEKGFDQMFDVAASGTFDGISEAQLDLVLSPVGKVAKKKVKKTVDVDLQGTLDGDTLTATLTGPKGQSGPYYECTLMR